MRTKIDITLHTRAPGCYPWAPERKDVIDTFYAHKGVFVLHGRSAQDRQLTDWAVQRLEAQNRLDVQAANAFKAQVYALFTDPQYAHIRSAEALDAAIQSLRCQCFGDAVMEELQRQLIKSPCTLDTADGIDQRAKKEAVMKSASAVLFVCEDMRMAQAVRADIEAALQEGKDVYVLAHEKPGRDIAGEGRWKALLDDDAAIQYLMTDDGIASVYAQDDAQAKRLNGLIAQGKAALLVYGEGGLLACRDLALEAVVHAAVQGYFARALTNQFDVDRACVAYVPKGLDVTRTTPLTEKTRLNYWHLFTLWAAHGDEIYAYTPEQLYGRYPQHFLNVYDNAARPAETMPGYPIRLAWEAEDASIGAYDALRERAIATYLGSIRHLAYRTAYMDEEGNLHPVHHQDDQVRGGVMVHSVKVEKADSASVISCEAHGSVRRMVRHQLGGGCEKLRIYSNFLFFLTPVLARLYNALRKDRPQEQIDFEKQHLDYMLVRDGEKRTETFPLFKKACIAMKEDGRFLFFNFRLGGGSIRIGQTALRWSREDVDPEKAQGRPVCVFTPYQSKADQPEDMAGYTKLVGEGRINLVIIQDRIICLRKGAVLLPSIGVVLSLDEKTGMQLIGENALSLDGDGYAHDAMPDPHVTLDPPQDILPEEWAQVTWAYGGGLSLILDGRGICDEDGPGMIACMEEEGWMSPLSRQTQESALHVPARHPRTAIGMTASGELVVLVYSGRTKRSGGADYAQMIDVAQKMYPDIRCLLNADGGGSAMLGMSVGDGFMELSYPSTSLDSCAGMVRPVNTVLCMEMA